MPRTKGAKNKLNAKELAAKLAAMENKTDVQNDSPPLADKPITPVIANQNSISNKADDIKITVPKRKKITGTPIREPKVYGCGNKKFCNYESLESFSVCPNCGVTNNWRSEHD
jgi:hypothetical protein